MNQSLYNSDTSNTVSSLFQSTTTDLAVSDGRKKLIPDDFMLYISIYLTISIPAIVTTFGVISNIINLVIFTKLGVKDSMSVGLWALSFSDLNVAGHNLGSCVLFVIDILLPDTLIDPMKVNYVSLLWSQDLFYLISNWTTTFISIERCVCVVAPFKVKSIFTKSRSIFIIFVIYAVHFASYISIFASHWLTYETIDTNSSLSNEERQKVMVIAYSHDRVIIHHAVDIINGAVLPVVQQALIIVSALWLSYGLKQSSKVRQSKIDSGDGGKTSTLSQKESRLVKVVLFLAIILTVCNIPRFVAVYCTILIHEMHMGMLYENTYVFLWALVALFASINASVNIWVYLLVNVSYRNTFKQMFCPGKMDDAKGGKEATDY